MRAPIILALCLAARAVCAQPALPDPATTPGAINPAVGPESIGNTICTPGWTRTVRPSSHVTNAIKYRLLTRMHASGYPDVTLRGTELDHLIPLALGGAPNDIRNLWLEPRAGEWGAARKDQLEEALSDLVCDGRIPLATAQAEMARDWISAYKRYVGGVGK